MAKMFGTREAADMLGVGASKLDYAIRAGRLGTVATCSGRRILTAEQVSKAARILGRPTPREIVEAVFGVKLVQQGQPKPEEKP